MKESRKFKYIKYLYFYSPIRKSDIMWFEGKWMQLEKIMLSEVSQVQKDKGHIFSYMWKTNPKDKHRHKNKCDHTQIHMQNMFLMVEIFYGT
jgi:hypothetical protein